jgi:hypothetical protein
MECYPICTDPLSTTINNCTIGIIFFYATRDRTAKTFEDFRLIDYEPLNINGRDAYDIFLSYKHPSKGMMTNEYIFIDTGDKLYTFSLQDTTTLGEYIRMATAMLEMVYSVEYTDSDRSVDTALDT